LDIPNRTNFYQYQIEISNDSVFNSGTYIGSGQPCDTKCEVGILAGLFGFCFDSCCSPLFCFISRKECFYHVTGVVYSAVQNNQKTDLLTLVCIDNTQEKKMPILVNRKYVCSPGSSPLL